MGRGEDGDMIEGDEGEGVCRGGKTGGFWSMTGDNDGVDEPVRA